jgi:hypothetical protein
MSESAPQSAIFDAQNARGNKEESPSLRPVGAALRAN